MSGTSSFSSPGASVAPGATLVATRYIRQTTPCPYAHVPRLSESQTGDAFGAAVRYASTRVAHAPYSRYTGDSPRFTRLICVRSTRDVSRIASTDVAVGTRFADGSTLESDRLHAAVARPQRTATNVRRDSGTATTHGENQSPNRRTCLHVTG